MIELIEVLTQKKWVFGDNTLPGASVSVVQVPLTDDAGNPLTDDAGNPVTAESQQIVAGGPFSFVGRRWYPGEYILINASDSNVSVILWNESFTVPAHTKWRFMAHESLESFHWLYGPPVGRQLGLPDPTERQAGPITSRAESVPGFEPSEESAAVQAPADRGVPTEPSRDRRDRGPTSPARLGPVIRPRIQTGPARPARPAPGVSPPRTGPPRVGPPTRRGTDRDKE